VQTPYIYTYIYINIDMYHESIAVCFSPHAPPLGLWSPFLFFSFFFTRLSSVVLLLSLSSIVWWWCRCGICLSSWTVLCGPLWAAAKPPPPCYRWAHILYYNRYRYI
jgi:hypothetical protein